MRVTHEFPPVYNGNSKVLILGSIPSPKSRERGFYYMHPQNRFWKIMGEILNAEIPSDADGRRAVCLKNGIALWDVLESCEIKGAEDSSIKNAVPNKLEIIFNAADIKAVFATGKTAFKLYNKFFAGKLPEAYCLPSTSPANRTVTYEFILSEYGRITEFIG